MEWKDVFISLKMCRRPPPVPLVSLLTMYRCKIHVPRWLFVYLVSGLAGPSLTAGELPQPRHWHPEPGSAPEGRGELARALT